MNPEQYRQLRDLFHRLCELDEPDRSRQVAAACGDDRELRRELQELLLRHDDEASTGGAFQESNLGVGLELIASSPENPPETESVDPPVQVGEYKVVGKIGAGGMGEVYRAVQAKPQRVIALKLLRPLGDSAAMARRFEREAQALGLLQHPGIAQIYEAATGLVTTQQGVSSRQPYLAMELIEGQSLRNSLVSLSIRRRLEIFARICDAIHHAHQKGVVHRDLKPGNILVTDDLEPKVLDFGIARILDPENEPANSETLAGRFFGTLTYMSPEQAAGDPTLMDTRSDVYSLGVILFELLSGVPPIDVASQPIHQAVRKIQEAEPRRLADWKRELRGDLSVICAKALEKDRDRRYASASELAADVRRHLSNQPIEARPATTAYLLSKFARRNKALVLAGTAVLLGLISGLSGALFGWRDANRSRDEAVKAREVALERQEMAEAAVHLIGETFGTAHPTRPGEALSAREYLDHAAQSIAESSEELGRVEPILRRALGSAYRELGLLEESAVQLELATDMARELLGTDDSETLFIEKELSRTYAGQRRFEQALSLANESLGKAEALHGRDWILTLDLLEAKAAVLFEESRLDEAETLMREVVSRRKQSDLSAKRLAASQQTLGTILSRTGDLETAESLISESLEWHRTHLGEDHPATNRCRGTLALITRLRGRLNESEERYREFLEVERRLHGVEHPRYAQALFEHAEVLDQLRRSREAVELGKQALSIVEGIYGSSHLQIVDFLTALAGFESRLGKPGRATELGRRALAILEQHPEAPRVSLARTKNLLAVARMLEGDLAEAESLTEEAIEIAVEVYGDFHSETLTLRRNLARVLAQSDRFEDALLVREDVLEAYLEMFEEPHVEIARAHYELGGLQIERGDLPAAEQSLRAGIDGFRESIGEEHLEVVLAQYSLGMVLEGQSRLQEALTSFEEAARIASCFLPPEHPEAVRAAVKLAGMYERLGDDQSWEELLRSRLEVGDPQHVEWARQSLRFMESQRTE